MRQTPAQKALYQSARNNNVCRSQSRFENRSHFAELLTEPFPKRLQEFCLEAKSQAASDLPHRALPTPRPPSGLWLPSRWCGLPSLPCNLFRHLRRRLSGDIQLRKVKRSFTQWNNVLTFRENQSDLKTD